MRLEKRAQVERNQNLLTEQHSSSSSYLSICSTGHDIQNVKTSEAGLLLLLLLVLHLLLLPYFFPFFSSASFRFASFLS